jgi:hypothetical protein
VKFKNTYELIVRRVGGNKLVEGDGRWTL